MQNAFNITSSPVRVEKNSHPNTYFFQCSNQLLMDDYEYSDTRLLELTAGMNKGTSRSHQVGETLLRSSKKANIIEFSPDMNISERLDENDESGYENNNFSH
jgi:hypothetical protein